MNTTTPIIGEGTRILHYLIDTTLICIFSYLLYRWWNFYVFYWGFEAYRYSYFFIGFTWVYTFVFECLFLRTPAKIITGTKVQSESGRRPNLIQFIIRATIRTLPISMFGIAWNDKPLHDTFSKTVLVKAKA
jgi:uncharacterized RDD family membrane protein YckC